MISCSTVSKAIGLYEKEETAVKNGEFAGSHGFLPELLNPHLK